MSAVPKPRQQLRMMIVDDSNVMRRRIERSQQNDLLEVVGTAVNGVDAVAKFKTLLPDVNLASSPWLFQQLTETLDRRVLAMLIKHDDRTVAGDVSINLNVQTLIAPEFLTFDDNLQAGMRGTIVLEVQKVDAFADLGSFLFARDFAHERGYRICIDGVDIPYLPLVDFLETFQ